MHEDSCRELHEALRYLTYLNKTNLSIRHGDQSDELKIKDEGKNLSVNNYNVQCNKKPSACFCSKINFGRLMSR